VTVAKDAQKQLNVNFAGNTTATIPFTVATLLVRVTDTHDPGRPIAGAQVTAKDGTTTLTQQNTDVNGVATLEITNLGTSQQVFTPKAITVVAAKSGFTQIAPSTKTVTVVTLATLDVRLVLQ
jgi:hypothetical protein